MPSTIVITGSWHYSIFSHLEGGIRITLISKAGVLKEGAVSTEQEDSPGVPIPDQALLAAGISCPTS